MKINILFLIAGLMLSATSKYLQYRYQSLTGDLLVFPAAIFLLLALLFSIPSYQEWFKNNLTHSDAILLALTGSGAVLSFQLFTWLVFGRGTDAGYYMLIPFLTLTAIAIRLIFKLKGG
ncbi:hypothetical protein JMA_32870 [Jeotgalibacillus malaysiensis]|uniref:Uncharacterized protein n=1 Tax=Jeotgalibacillus malaysiensis TaxID=1508404 RepID=A0A0B5AX55_9BACL|nr:hypothetical protein [Jeotgalibacillus malaysiensis]AJD92604.1 hypothetical protein JMA_32870 [Jeotgalibacillus malaysiensis]